MNRSSEMSHGDAINSHSRELNVALLTLDFPPSTGGVQQYLYEISRRIGRHCRLTVITPGPRAPEHVHEPFELIHVPGGTLASYWQAVARLRPDITVVGHSHPRLLIPAAGVRRRYVAVAHGNDFEAAQTHWHRPLFNRLLQNARPVVTHCTENAQRLRELSVVDPVIIWPGTDPDRFSPSPEPRSGPPILLSVGRLVPRKGFDTVLQALPALLQRMPQLKYRVAGDGPQRASLQALAQDLQVSHAVEFLGYVPVEHLPETYRGATIFVMPSRTNRLAGDVEGFGIVYLEASASGLPVVAAASGGAVDAVRDGETGLLVPPDDPAALALALARLLDDPARCRQMGAAGRRWVEDEMDWDRAAAQFLAVLEAPH